MHDRQIEREFLDFRPAISVMICFADRLLVPVGFHATVTRLQVGVIEAHRRAVDRWRMTARRRLIRYHRQPVARMLLTATLGRVGPGIVYRTRETRFT